MFLHPDSLLGDIVSAFLTHLEVRTDRRDLQKATLGKYRRDLGRSKQLHHLRLSALEAGHILDWFDGLQLLGRDGLPSASAPFEALRTLRNCLQWCIKRRILKINPASSLGKSFVCAPGRPIDPPQLARLFQALDKIDARRAQGNRQRAPHRPGYLSASTIVRLLALTGARLNEITSARREYLDEGWTRITWTRGKNKRKRVILLGPLGQRVLRDRLEQDAALGNPYCFPSPADPHNKGISKAAVWNVIKEAAQLANIPGLRLNDLRHSCATMLQSMGRDIDTIMAVLGHVRRDSLNVYLHCTNPPRVRVALDEFEQHVWEGV